MVTTRIIDSEPALILEEKRKNLVISDLHIGFEDKFSSNKNTVKKNSSINEIISNVTKIIKKENPETLILLGDVKSSIQSITDLEWKDIPYFFEEIKNSLEVILVPGNHDSHIDRLIPNDVTVISSKGMILDDVLLTHGHTMPSKNYSSVNNIIMGHIHPVYFDKNSLLNGERIWISIKSDKSKIFPDTKGNLNITIVPSFNPYFYATEKKYYKKSISPIVEKIKDSTTAKILTLDGTIIGNESILKDLI
ncbi:MAG: metallophosphoesterase [Thaumarchaeota archaeon]|jgi:putative SbcD/Mre11-related phosphoesterase|nr:metallophosphoesterase [Nitrososphaerota archaeon]MBT3743153.1 metallophosphoesterase [Nitrososphaerota archaeon]MBT4056921.1 metallophosphoesterase [Nitrososphaerota archaeon]MBT4176068.1 metallophosphoesterase [Nitrososphaerota archaeon]MBT4509357.1 metallophosphoesterase [Nitrososphaerota archaeon]